MAAMQVARNSVGNAWSQHDFGVVLGDGERKYSADDSNSVMMSVFRP